MQYVQLKPYDSKWKQLECFWVPAAMFLQVQSDIQIQKCCSSLTVLILLFVDQLLLLVISVVYLMIIYYFLCRQYHV